MRQTRAPGQVVGHVADTSHRQRKPAPAPDQEAARAPARPGRNVVSEDTTQKKDSFWEAAGRWHHTGSAAPVLGAAVLALEAHGYADLVNLDERPGDPPDPDAPSQLDLFLSGYYLGVKIGHALAKTEPTSLEAFDTWPARALAAMGDDV